MLSRCTLTIAEYYTLFTQLLIMSCYVSSDGDGQLTLCRDVSLTSDSNTYGGVVIYFHQTAVGSDIAFG